MSEPPTDVIPVRAVVRGRPLIPKEVDEGCQTCLDFFMEENRVMVNGSKSFTFDNVFSADVSQADVYDIAVKPLTEGFFKGYHATVLAYGQTGSGKTYSMGSAHSATAGMEDATTGIIPRVINDIFTGINERSTHNFTVKVSYLELYMKDLNDLLCPRADRQQIVIRDADDGGTHISGLTELVVANVEETFVAMDRGNSHRTTAATAMNLVSSRSHAIFTIILESVSKENENDKVLCKFHLVDLAGSERAKRTKAEGERLQEGIKINEGLLALGNVISALADENLRSGHIKYRDSKLTRILQGSLGGNSHTLMIACVSPADSNHEETVNTLRYADRVRKIKNRPVVNRDPQAALIASMKKEIQNLKLQLLERGLDIQPMDVVSSKPVESNSSLQEKINKLSNDNVKLTEQLQQSVENYTEMCEKAIVTELCRDKMQEQLLEITKFAKNLIEEFPDMYVVGENNEDLPMNERYKKLLAFHKLVLGTHPVGTQELMETVLNENDDTLAENGEGSIQSETVLEANASTDPQNMTQAMTSEHAMKKADLGKQLQELSKALSIKEELAKRLTSNDAQITAMKGEYEAKLQALAKEKASLELALQQAQKTNESRKLSEKRRQRLNELSTEIQALKKEKKEKEKLVRMKTESDRSIDRLNTEIREMKRNRVNLMKQIKAENEKFNAWKKEKAKEVKQLQEKNRKRNFEYVKLERTYDKQKAILRRKTEEAAAANKRLKEALSKREAAAVKRKATEKRTMDTAGPKIRAWLDEEIEVRTSIREVEHHRNVLLEDRASLAKELKDTTESPKKRRRTFDAESDIRGSQRRSEIQQEIGLKSAQIQSLQIKLSEAKEQLNSNTKWTNIGTLLDAKCALKYLIKLIVDAKIENALQKDETANMKREREAAEEIVKELQNQLRETINRHELDKTLLQQTHAVQVSDLLSDRTFSMSNSFRGATDGDNEMAKYQDEIKMLKAEKNELHKQLLEKRISSTTTPAAVKNQSFFKPIKQMDQSVEDIFDEPEDTFDAGDDTGSEYEPTPQKKRKRTSVTGCGCSKSKYLCRSSMCGCVKKSSKCTKDCKCAAVDGSACYNQEQTSAFLNDPANATFDIEPETKTSTPTFLFPRISGGEGNKENSSPDIIPRTPLSGLENKNTSKYTPVYFQSPIVDEASADSQTE